MLLRRTFLLPSKASRRREPSSSRWRPSTATAISAGSRVQSALRRAAHRSPRCSACSKRARSSAERGRRALPSISAEAPMHIALAQPADISAWLDLAAEVEFLFGPMVADPGFRAALERTIQRQTAFCIREQDGAPGSPLMGGLLFSATQAPHYKIGWLAVAERWRRQGVAQMLVEHCFQLIQAPAELSVVTFGEDNVEGRPARRFYERMSFQAAEAAPNGPEGGTRQVFRRQFV